MKRALNKIDLSPSKFEELSPEVQDQLKKAVYDPTVLLSPVKKGSSLSRFSLLREDPVYRRFFFSQLDLKDGDQVKSLLKALRSEVTKDWHEGMTLSEKREVFSKVWKEFMDLFETTGKEGYVSYGSVDLTIVLLMNPLRTANASNAVTFDELMSTIEVKGVFINSPYLLKGIRNLKFARKVVEDVEPADIQSSESLLRWWSTVKILKSNAGNSKVAVGKTSVSDSTQTVIQEFVGTLGREIKAGNSKLLEMVLDAAEESTGFAKVIDAAL